MDLKSRIVVFIGPEGSDKTTMATMLSKQSRLPRITTGDIIRDLAKNDTGPLGEECRTMFAAKGYLSGESLLKILVQRFCQDDVTEGLILDGGMRTLQETRAFRSVLDQANLKLPLTVIHLQIPYWTSYLRLVFGKNARKRPDDTLSGVFGRLSKFHFQLHDRISVIQEQPDWELRSVNANKEIEEVYQEVLRWMI
ncbi:hypothetical protein A3K29_02080 [Candidatus Collierbacteria bacterium RIFOXYB2_FULL_46_14]|uniref:Adenylate kinase n=1 Tax=Candidatus Collierbacteria bacterium GW2011_GWA2_46_26 TaxID=1618381 RepID=A0A0G1RSJ7_9BACT|nr:MAG: Adenylate kinase [Candidatus Collierbacteria bacterium GW2011_GWC2_44_13]KKU32938.1 MAG: Adenylate kinase [Candidatus Collierbacteria bacterium GW2011_GWA2_46_26]OGD72915.1 MAG: hypothetical protein A3K29_02080 [Candidatus Collierbacteria bacterium RIFOXYB2_FULL_46_14]OGD75957.1 MAG: hypothetical protein A3K43_02080 [Candidatus Collierbacteria bacterium RIFOXYA2_FULL_46_20]OGD77293.1 MAG: hypothetical protein A3K39_02080 [Candidatus Collierbacteria bacterium RIFOXYC2_FULL_43_15]OGD8058